MSLETDVQFKRLCDTYSERSDDELLDMDERRGDLTELAQQALAQVMKERGLEPEKLVEAEPEKASAADFDESTRDDWEYVLGLAPDEDVICSFSDAFRANDAVRVVTEAGISCRIVDLNLVESQHSQDRTYLINLGMVVKEADRDHAAKVLAEVLQLPVRSSRVPVGPHYDGGLEAVGPLPELAMLAIFSREEALIAAQVLGEAGISFLWRDGKESHDLLDEGSVALEVTALKVDEATSLIGARTAALEEDGALG